MTVKKKRHEIPLAEYEGLSALPVEIRGKSNPWPFGVILSYLRKCERLVVTVTDVRLAT